VFHEGGKKREERERAGHESGTPEKMRTWVKEVKKERKRRDRFTSEKTRGAGEENAIQ